MKHAEIKEVVFQSFDQDVNKLMELLSSKEVLGIWEDDDEVHVYVKDRNVDMLQLQLLAYDAEMLMEVRDMPNVNWNKEWEKSFEPVYVDDFCHLRAPFHPEDKSCTHTITMMPKQAFGTGHHDTTYMMLQAMKSINFKNKNVLDLGCGTAVLSILAELMGADHIEAIDHERPAVLNAKEHIRANDCDNIKVQHADLNYLDEKEYDVVLANINSKVLADYASVIKSKVGDRGHLLLSGILIERKEEVKTHYRDLNQLEEKTRGEWVLIHYLKI